MTITFSQFESREQSQKRFLLIFDIVERGNISNKQTVYATSLPVRGFSHNYIPMLKGVPEITKSIQGLESQAMPSWGDIVCARNIEIPLINYVGSPVVRVDDLLSGAWMVNGQDIRILYGGDELPENEYKIICQGKAKNLKAFSRKDFTIGFVDSLGVLGTINVNPNTITAAEFPNAPDSNIGKQKPICIGFCRNISPTLVNAQTWTYLFHDVSTVGYNNLEAVFADGVPVSYTHNNNGTFRLTYVPVGNITCTVKGAEFGSPAVYKTKLGDISVGLLKSFAGWSDSGIDAAAITQFNSDIPYDFGFFADTKLTVKDVLNQLFSGLPAIYTMSRDSIFGACEFRKPTGSGYVKIPAITDFKGKYEPDVIYKKRVKYDRNRSVIPENQSGGTDLAWKTWLASEWREEGYESSSVKSGFPLSIEDPKIAETCLLNRADAVAVATKWVNLLGCLRYGGDFETKPLRLAHDVAKEINFRFSQLGMAAGINARIMNLRENYGQNRSQMNAMVWV